MPNDCCKGAEGRGEAGEESPTPAFVMLAFASVCAIAYNTYLLYKGSGFLPPPWHIGVSGIGNALPLPLQVFREERESDLQAAHQLLQSLTCAEPRNHGQERGERKRKRILQQCYARVLTCMLPFWCRIEISSTH